eukprot:gene25989-11679_t
MAETALEAVSCALKECQFELVAKILDAQELESPNHNVLVEWPHSLHLLGHIYNKNLFLWKRIPHVAKRDNAELEATFKLLQFCWNRNYAGMWQALQAHQWSPMLAPLVQAISVKTRQELVELIGISYSTVSPTKVASICGVSEAEALSVCTALGWQYDTTTGMLSVVRAPPPKVEQDGFRNLTQLSSYMTHLEAGA